MDLMGRYTVPPALRDRDLEVLVAGIEASIAEREREIRAEARRAELAFFGPERCRKQSPFDFPKTRHVKGRLSPAFAAGTAQAHKRAGLAKCNLAAHHLPLATRQPGRGRPNQGEVAPPLRPAAWLPACCLVLAVACGHAGTPLYAGPARAASEVAVLHADAGLMIAAIYDAQARAVCGGASARAACPDVAALSPGRYRVIARAARWPGSAIDAELAPDRTYVARVTARQEGLSAAAGDLVAGRSYATAVALVDAESNAAVAAGVPEQEAALLPPGAPLRRDPRAPRCPPYAPDVGCTPLPTVWYSDGEPRPEL